MSLLRKPQISQETYCFIYIVRVNNLVPDLKPEKTGDILRGHQGFLREISSEELAQKFMTCHSTDTPVVQLRLPDLRHSRSQCEWII